MDYLSVAKNNKTISNLNNLMNDYHKNKTSNTNLNKGKKEILLKNYNNYSLLKHNYGNGELKNISINFGFPNSRNTYKYKNAFPISKYPIYEQRNIFYYDTNFELFKNKSVSKYGEKKKKNNASSHLTRNNSFFSPQHKIMTSIKKKKLRNTDERNNKQNEKDVYEVEVINTVLYDDEDNIEKKEFVNEEWGEIEQEIEQKEKNKTNNLLNSVFVEIEKEDGDKQFKVVEISKDDKKPCIRVKYTIEDKICLNALNDTGGDDLISLYDKDTKDSGIRSPNYKTNTNSTFKNNFNSSNNINYSINSLGRSDDTTNLRNTSNLLLDNKTTQNLHSSRDNFYFSGSMPLTENYQRYSNYKQQYEQQKEGMRTDTYHKDNKNDLPTQNRLYKGHSEGIFEKKERYNIKKEPGEEFNNNYFEVNKNIKKYNESWRKVSSPRNNKEEIQINIESGLNGLKTPLRNISTHSPKSSLIKSNIDDITNGIKEKYGDKSRKESIADKELKIINIELKKPKYGIEKSSTLSSNISPKKTELQKYNKNNYFLTKQKSIDNLFNTQIANKSQYLKDTKTEKPITTSRFDEIDSKRSFLRPNVSENNYDIKKEEDKSQSILSRLNIYSSGEKEKKDNYLSEKKDGFMPRFNAKVNIKGISTKKEGFKKTFGETDSLGGNVLAKKGLTNVKSEALFVERHNTYQNKSQDNTIGNLGNLGNIGSIGSIGTLREKEEKDRLERERKEKERKEREKLQIEKEMERMERERQRKEREKEREKEIEKQRLEREKKEKERIEKIEKEKQEKERREREKQERKERERKEREQKEKERKEQIEREKKERYEKKEKERLEREKERERKKQESMTRFSMRSSDSYQNKKEDIMGTRRTSGKKVIEESPSIRNYYKTFLENSPTKMNIGQIRTIGTNNVRKIEISKDISNRGEGVRGSDRGSDRGRDSEEKIFRYSSIGTDKKREENTESRIIRSRFDEKEGNDILSKLNKTKGISLRNINELIENKIAARSFKNPDTESGTLFKRSYQLTEKQKKPENKYIKKTYQKYEPNTIDSKLNNRTNIIIPNQDIKIRDMKKIFQLPESKSIKLSETQWTRSKDDIKTQEKEKKYLDLPSTQYNLNNILKKEDSFNINKYLINDSKRASESKDEIRKIQSRTVDKYLKRESFSKKDILEREREKQEKKEREKKEREEKARIERERKEKEKKEKEEKDKKEKEKIERERKEKERERERQEKERKEKLEREKKEKERERNREKQERERQEKLERERKEKERQEKLAKEKREKERQRLEKEKIEFEKQKKLEKERLERDKQEKIERDRIERERKERAEKERKEREKREKEKQDKLERDKKEKERLERERKERLEREKQEKERLEKERKEKLEKERQERERKEYERLEKLEREKQERLEKERQEKERRERERQEKLEKERQERERKEQERQEQLEKERQERERKERERLEKFEREKQERLERERQEKERRERERQEKLERERQERERRERERQERLERERQEKERRERERQERLEKERLEKERKEKERLEREKQKQLEKERLEKERKEKLRLEKFTKLDSTQTDSNAMKQLKLNKSKGKKMKKRVKFMTEKKEEDSSEMTSPKNESTTKNKFLRFTQTPEETQNNEEETIKKQNLFLIGTEELKENELISRPRREEYKIDIPSQKLTKGKIEDELEEDSKFRDKGFYKGKKVKMNIRIDDDNSSGQVASEHLTSEDVNKYKSFRKKKNKKYNLDIVGQNEDENEIGISQKIEIRHQNSLRSNLSESFLRGMPTKIKVYKCVIWRNIAPGVNEDTIKNILHRSGSQILKKGGFIVKLSKKPLLKTSKKSN